MTLDGATYIPETMLFQSESMDGCCKNPPGLQCPKLLNGMYETFCCALLPLWVWNKQYFKEELKTASDHAFFISHFYTQIVRYIWYIDTDSKLFTEGWWGCTRVSTISQRDFKYGKCLLFPSSSFQWGVIVGCPLAKPLCVFKMLRMAYRVSEKSFSHDECLWNRKMLTEFQNIQSCSKVHVEVIQGHLSLVFQIAHIVTFY